MQKQKLVTLIGLLVLSLCSLGFAQTSDGLEIQISGQNGSADFSANRTTSRSMDSAIRVLLTCNNTKLGKITITKVEGVFYDADGKELEKVSAGPVVIPSKGSEIIGLYYPNLEQLYEFTLKGTVTFEKGGKTTTVPFSADASSLVLPRIVNF